MMKIALAMTAAWHFEAASSAADGAEGFPPIPEKVANRNGMF